MKEKEPESYIEKARTYRDRSKRRRGDKGEEVAPTNKPKLEPYHKPKRKNWVNQIDEE